MTKTDDFSIGIQRQQKKNIPSFIYETGTSGIKKAEDLKMITNLC